MATRSSTEPVTYFNVTFDVNSTSGELVGDTNVKLSSKTAFKDINKPTYKKDSGLVLYEWTKDKQGLQKIDPSLEISSDMTVYAQWIEATKVKTITFNKGTADELVGPTEVQIIEGATFSTINKPEAKKTAGSVYEYTFDYWSTDGTETTKITEDTVISTDKVLIPTFKQSARYTKIKFTKKAEESNYTVKFNGTTTPITISLNTTTPFADINKPEVTKTRVVATKTYDYPFANKWVVKNATTGEYEDVPATFTYSENAVEVYPVFSEEPTILESEYYVNDETKGLGVIINGSESEGDTIDIQYENESSPISIDKSEFDKRVYIGSKITSISPNFLRGCSKYNQLVEIPANVTYIGSGFLYGCNAFNNGQTSANAQKLVIPSTITSIGNCFMYECSSFNQTIEFNEGLKTIGDFFMFSNSNFNATLALPSTLTTIGNSFLYYCTAFNNGDANLTIPANVTSIGDGFLKYNTALVMDGKTIDLSNATSLTKINDSFLYGNSSFVGTVKLPTSLTEIGDNFLAWNTSAFKAPNFTDLTSLTTIGGSFLNNDKAINFAVDLSKTKVTTIGSRFLRTCSTINSVVTLPTTLTTIGDEFMFGCAAFNQAIALPTNLSSIGKSFLRGCYAFNQKISLPSNITVIPAEFLYCCWAWNNGPNEDVFTIPTSVTSIGDHFLYRCYTYDNTLTIPSSVKSIGDYFLFGCAIIGTLTINCTNISCFDQTGNSFWKSFNESSKTYQINGNGTIKASALTSAFSATSKSYVVDGETKTYYRNFENKY